MYRPDIGQMFCQIPNLVELTWFAACRYQMSPDLRWISNPMTGLSLEKVTLDISPLVVVPTGSAV